MPCIPQTLAPTPAEWDAGFRKELDRLTRENDELREFLLALKNDVKLTTARWHKIEKDQAAHRKEDLKRLEATLRDAIKADPTAGLYEELGRVIMADPNKPLQPQLGFNPDSL